MIRPALALLALLSLFAGGCTWIGPQPCDRSPGTNPPLVFEGGTVNDGVYMTSNWDGEWLFFPGGMRYNLVTNLGTVPSQLSAYLSFNEYGSLPGDGGAFAPAAGDQVQFLCEDSQHIFVANGECVEYWLLVTAQAGTDNSAPNCPASP
jgi:hypothetical protein